MLYSGHRLSLVGVLGCRLDLNLQLVDLVQEVGNLLFPLIELDVLHLNGIL
jgi:hypothetical protein